MSALKRPKFMLIGGAALAVFAAIMVFMTRDSGERVNALPNGVAVDGFDVVAFFADGRPQHGDPKHSVNYKGKVWRFSSAENAVAFSETPEKYAPQFNGFCAYAVSEGYSAEVDFVDGWVIIEERLYLNWNEETKDTFIDEQATRLQKAARNWPVVHAGLKTKTVPFYTHLDEGVDISHPQQIN